MDNEKGTEMWVSEEIITLGIKCNECAYNVKRPQKVQLLKLSDEKEELRMPKMSCPNCFSSDVNFTITRHKQ